MRNDIHDEQEIDRAYVLRNLREVAERCLQRAPVLQYNRSTRSYEPALDEAGNAVWQFDVTGAIRALELLGKHLGIFSEKQDQGEVRVVHEYADDWRRS